MANKLAEESSPYLLQHAQNPVDWYPWGPEALNRSKSEDKPILLSIGYSSCHWCHVMERESFENEQIAQLMNELLVCIKVDREERPDIDQIYMDAIQAMGIQGGWPLNVFLTPDQRPFYGGTYFAPRQWFSLVQQIGSAFAKNRNQLEDSALNFTKAIANSFTPSVESSSLPTVADITEGYQKLSQGFDRKYGGTEGAPKFPMPVEWNFGINYVSLTGDREARDQLDLTLKSMALGGIYDQVGGGFARYSVDERWFAPHFEKMLYDNAQLLSLYSNAHRLLPSTLYQTVVEETITFIKREMTDPLGGFYSALDADSEGIEGKYYVWTYDELKALLAPDFKAFSGLFGIEPEGNWEHGANILEARTSPTEYAESQGIAYPDFEKMLSSWKGKLLGQRSKRIRPGLDDKILSGWNGLMIKGLCDAYGRFQKPEFLELAVKSGHFLREKMIHSGGIYRSYRDGEAKVQGYLEDLALVALGFSSLYQVTFDREWLTLARQLTDQAINQFYDPEDGFFFFTSSVSEALIARKKELFDNVIPSSNSVMAQVLFQLGTILEDEKYLELSKQMISQMKELTKKHPGSLANWATFMTQFVSPNFEIAIVGPEAIERMRELKKSNQSHAVYMGSQASSDLPLLSDKNPEPGKTMIYVCSNRTCQLPVETAEQALEQLN